MTEEQFQEKMADYSISFGEKLIFFGAITALVYAPNSIKAGNSELLAGLLVIVCLGAGSFLRAHGLKQLRILSRP